MREQTLLLCLFAALAGPALARQRRPPGTRPVRAAWPRRKHRRRPARLVRRLLRRNVNTQRDPSPNRARPGRTPPAKACLPREKLLAKAVRSRRLSCLRAPRRSSMPCREPMIGAAGSTSTRFGPSCGGSWRSWRPDTMRAPSSWWMPHWLACLPGRRTAKPGRGEGRLPGPPRSHFGNHLGARLRALFGSSPEENTGDWAGDLMSTRS